MCTNIEYSVSLALLVLLVLLFGCICCFFLCLLFSCRSLLLLLDILVVGWFRLWSWCEYSANSVKAPRSMASRNFLRKLHRQSPASRAHRRVQRPCFVRGRFILLVSSVLLDKGVLAMDRLTAPPSATLMVARRLTVHCPGSDAAACVAGAADGTTVVLEARHYTWLNEITIGNKRLTIMGAGKGSTTVDREAGGRFFTLTSGGSIVVKHLKMTGGKVRVTVGRAVHLVMLHWCS